MTMKERWHQTIRQAKAAFSKLFKTGGGSGIIQTEQMDGSDGITRQEVLTIPVGSLKAEDLQVKVQNGYLVVAAKRSWAVNHEGVDMKGHYSGQTVSKRMFPLKNDIQPQMIEARVKAGQLMIHIPLDTDESQETARKIKVS